MLFVTPLSLNYKGHRHQRTVTIMISIACVTSYLRYIQVQIGDYKDNNELDQKIKDIHKAVIHGGPGTKKTCLTDAMTAMRAMFGADQRFRKSLERFVTVIISSGFVFDMDRLEKATVALFTAGVDFISIGKGISRSH